MGGRCDQQVLDRGEVAEHPRELKCPDQAAPCQAVHRLARHIDAVEHDAASRRGEKTTDHVQCGRLAGAVRTDQSGDGASLDGERHHIHRLHAAVILGQVFDLEDRPHRRGQLAWPP